MDIHQIEAARKELQVTQYDLCKRADINPSTYTRIIGRGTATRRILGKLKRAVDDIRNGYSTQPATLDDVRAELAKLMGGGQ